MKKTYEKPQVELVKFCFAEQIAASGTSCYWSSGATWTHALEGCDENYIPGTPGWIGLNG